MKKVRIYCQGNETPTSFEFNQPEGCTKVYNCYKNLTDDYQISDVTNLTVYGFDNVGVQKDFESFKSTLPKYLQKYVKVTKVSNWLGEDGYVDNSKLEPCIVVGVETRHKYNENQIKKVKRLYNETINFFNLK